MQPPENATSHRSWREREARLSRLVGEELPQNRRDIQEAKEFGDLSENFEYESARAKERQLLSRLETLQKELKEVKPFDYSKVEPGETAGVATCVRLAYPDGAKRTISILGLWDIDKALGIVSCQAPRAHPRPGACTRSGACTCSRAHACGSGIYAFTHSIGSSGSGSRALRAALGSQARREAQGGIASESRSRSVRRRRKAEPYQREPPEARPAP